LRTEDALVECAETVRRVDPDRYFAALFAPEEQRPLLFALYAFNHEVARAAEMVREPMLGAIRLQWWREAIEAARDGRPRAHPVSLGLAELFARAAPPQEWFDTLIDAREFDLGTEGFADLGALEAHTADTSGMVMRIACHVLDVYADARQIARDAGIAFGLAGILRAIPFHAARRKLFLPASFLEAECLSADDIFAGRETAKLKRILARIADCARSHHGAARASPKPGLAFAALLPAALVPLYLKCLTARDFEPLRDPSEVAQFRRQWTLLKASLRGTL
jgi:phytoene synthase